MINIDIPDYQNIEAKHLVLDYNGTLAIDGKLIDGTRQLLELIGRKLSIHVLTADTFGMSKEELIGINCKLVILHPGAEDRFKLEYVDDLNNEEVIAIGNGANDALMLEVAALGIVVIQKEGASIQSIKNADIVCVNIIDALELLIYPQRIEATLRK
jgi:soluble P-type ATPase